MRARHLTLLFLLYVVLDLSNPFVPGAFNFDPDDSVDGVSRSREQAPLRLQGAPSPVPATPTADAGRVAPPAVARSVRVPRAVNDWHVDARRIRSRVPEVSTPTEDH
jgi:hypothetical protein